MEEFIGNARCKLKEAQEQVTTLNLKDTSLSGTLGLVMNSVKHAACCCVIKFCHPT